jgi:hypothetical protein
VLLLRMGAAENFDPCRSPSDQAPPTASPPDPLQTNPQTMAKSSSNNKKRKAASQSTAKSPTPAKKASTAGAASAAAAEPTVASAAVVGRDVDDSLIGGSIYPEELEAAIEVLRALAAQPELMKAGKGGGGLIKSFKGAMWDCWRALGEVSGTGQPPFRRLDMYTGRLTRKSRSSPFRLEPHEPDLDDAPERSAPRIARPAVGAPAARPGAQTRLAPALGPRVRRCSCSVVRAA